MADKELKSNEIGINLEDYQGSCSTKETIDQMANELLSDLIHSLANTTARLSTLEKNHDFLTDKAKLIKRQADLQSLIDTRKNQLLKRTPLLTQMYNLRESAKNEPNLKPGEKIESKIEFNADGSPYLKISKKMGEAIGFDFTITGDGKVVFGQMSDDKMVEVIDFLYRRGITNFELPQGAPRTPEEAQKRVEDGIAAKKELDQQTLNNKLEDCKKYDDPTNNPRYIADPEPEISEEDKKTKTPEELKQINEQSAAQNAGIPEARTVLSEEGSAFAAAQAQGQSAAPGVPAAPKPKFKPAEEFQTYVEKKLKRTRPNGYRRSHNILDGSTTFSVYANNDVNYKKQKQKKGSKEEPGLLYRVKIKREKDGSLGLNYYIPKNGKVPDELAVELVDLAKKDGALFIEFPKDIPETDGSVFRKACAQKGMIPIGGVAINTVDQAQKVIKEASILDNDKLLEYKGKLGQHLLEKATKTNNKDLAAYAQQLIDEQKLEKLKLCFENDIMPEIDNMNTETKAEEIIGAAEASNKLYDLFTNQIQKPAGEVFNNLNLTAEEIRNLQIPSNVQINDLDPNQLKSLYDILKTKYTKEAANQLETSTAHKPDDKIQDIVDKRIDSASKKLQNVGRKFARKGIQSIGFQEFSTAKYQKPSGSRSAAMAKSSVEMDI